MFDIEDHPLPDWADSVNKDRAPLLHSQLFTKDSSRTGNATVIDITLDRELGFVFNIRTDIGNEFKYTLRELNAHYTIGPYLIKKGRLPNMKLEEARAIIKDLLAEYRALDLPYGSKAYQRGNEFINK